MSERLIRVERFEELRAGMLVVCTKCECGVAHRGLLMPAVSTPAGLAFPVLPAPRCHVSLSMAPGGFVVWWKPVNIGAVYRVDDGLDLAAETAEAKRKPVRAR